ncbi:CAP domain-containing protein [Cupriavidus sp. IK-TO18]|uniref:CAP domain-containing protein n=1 Tax=Cupriavidus sp. IK-TO18 TaxID=2782182 RepID=UPI001899DC10|nr:CAP domain-containing protein [Cupriavidus sp. IK-TO18]MBF6989376.1 CAP domain-containing protein [Cupriavidus sp. IK-TO18]
MNVSDPTYTQGSGHLALFKGINTLRQKLGVGLLAQDAALDTAAQAHAIYLSAHSVAQHDQTAGSQHLYEATPLLRAQKAGVRDSQWVAEVVGAARGPNDSEIGIGCVDQWYHTVYHLQSLVTNQESIGIGYSGTGALGLNHCVLDFGTITATQPSPTPNGVPYGGGQQFDPETFVTVPADGDIGVQGEFNFAGESPNPAPDLPTPGRPLMVYANGALAEVLAVTDFKLVASNGAEVAARVLVSPAAKADGSNGVADEYLRNNAAFLLPLAPLADRETYTASFSGTRAGKPVSISWTFKTATATTAAFR